MSTEAEQRMRAFEEIFLDAATRTEGFGPEGFDPVEALYRSVASSDGTIQFAPLGALLVAELDAWQRIGLQIGYFVGERRYQAAVSESDVLKIYFALMSNSAQADQDLPASVDEFQDALLNAVEDLRPERLELIDLVVIATDEQAAPRIGAVHQVTKRISETGLGRVEGQDGLSWALAGRESTIEGWAGPAGWRSNAALDAAPRLSSVNSAGAALAIATLVEAVGEDQMDDIYEIVYRETGEGGRVAEA